MNDHILTPSAACFNLIKASEGCRLSAYPDPGTGGDPWTIGGRVLPGLVTRRAKEAALYRGEA